MNKKDKKNLLQYYKNSRPPGYKDKKLESTDIAYIELIEMVTDLCIMTQRKFFDENLIGTSSDAMELAWRIVGYLDDVVNQVGIFKALTDKNLEIFGSPLPLFVRTAEDVEKFTPGIVNYHAVVYLVWDFLTEVHQDFIMPPTHPFINILTYAIFQLLEKTAKIPRRSITKEFLTLSGSKDGGFVKNRLVWLGLDSYLFRFAARNYLADKEKRISTLEDFLLQKSTRISGYTPLDIFVRMADLDEESKKELQRWEEPHVALYHIEEFTGDYWWLKNEINQKQYKVLVEYNPGSLAKGVFCIAGLVPWQGHWRWSGEQTLYKELNAKEIASIIEVFKTEHPHMIYRYCDEEREKAFRYAKEQSDFFYRHFKTNLVTFDSGYTMRDHWLEFFRAFNKAKLKEASAETLEKYNLPDGVPPLELPGDILESDDTAIFHRVDRGFDFFVSYRQFTAALEKKGQGLTEEEEDLIYFFVTDSSIRYQLFHHLQKDYSFESIGYTFRITEWNDQSDLEYLLRRYKGRQYKEKYPNIRIV